MPTTTTHSRCTYIIEEVAFGVGEGGVRIEEEGGHALKKVEASWEWRKSIHHRHRGGIVIKPEEGIRF
jgi:hypothetical protein